MYAETRLSEVDDDLRMFCTVVRFAQSLNTLTFLVALLT